MIAPPWLQALESQLEALASVKKLLAVDTRDRITQRMFDELSSGWQVDRWLLEHAAPYAWSDEVTRAVLAASKSIPLDTELHQWNLSGASSFWHFEKPLPFRTTRLPMGVRALVFGLVKTTDRGFGLPVCTWIDDPLNEWKIIPSQTFEWRRTDTLGVMLEATRAHHLKLYGPGGQWSDREHTTLEEFMTATEGMARFMLAAFAWLDQKVIITDAGHIERHRRKAFNRETKQDLQHIRVVQLRKNEYPAREHGESEVEWSCRWAVSGHWRNQACGPKHGDRKLRYIMPFVKGPSDKPFREGPKKVYEIVR